MGFKALVLGATGAVGTALVQQLAAAPHVSGVIALSRRPISYDSPKVQNKVLDFRHLNRGAKLMQGDVLFSCLGTTLKRAGSLSQQREVDLDYQYRVAKIAADNGVAQYFLVSSSGANANSRNAYLQMKGELEQQVLKLPFRRVVILQPSLLVGEREESRLGEQLAAKVLPTLCRLPLLRAYRPIKVEQVAAKMVRESTVDGPSPQWFKLDEIFS